MVTNVHDIGDVVRLKLRVKDPETGALIDPATITLTIEPPSGPSIEIDAGAIIKDSVGLYHADADVCTEAGDYVARWVTIDPKGAEEHVFRVRPSKVLG